MSLIVFTDGSYNVKKRTGASCVVVPSYGVYHVERSLYHDAHLVEMDAILQAATQYDNVPLKIYTDSLGVIESCKYYKGKQPASPYEVLVTQLVKIIESRRYSYPVELHYVAAHGKESDVFLKEYNHIADSIARRFTMQRAMSKPQYEVFNKKNIEMLQEVKHHLGDVTSSRVVKDGRYSFL